MTVAKEPTRVHISGDTIRLDQFLKWAGVAQTGGQAKAMVLDGRVCVNGEQELRRGRKLHPGDIVAVTVTGNDGTVDGQGRRPVKTFEVVGAREGVVGAGEGSDGP